MRTPTFHRVSTAMFNSALMRPSGILCLFTASGPAYIARFVMAIVVNTIKRQIGGRSHTNIGNEVSETQAPSFTDRDASIAVVMKGCAVRVVAALNHAAPYNTFRRMAQAVCSSFVLAATRLRQSDTQAADKHRACCAANATAQQKSQSVLPWCFTENGPREHHSARGHFAAEFVDVGGDHNANNSTRSAAWT